jgi:hypothetical protein
MYQLTTDCGLLDTQQQTSGSMEDIDSGPRLPFPLLQSPGPAFQFHVLSLDNDVHQLPFYEVLSFVKSQLISLSERYNLRCHIALLLAFHTL